MALVGLHYSGFFKDKLLSGRIKGTVLHGEWSFPESAELFVFLAKGDAMESSNEKKVGIASVKECKSMKVNELTDVEADYCGFDNCEKLQEAVKFWHKCDDYDSVTFVKFEFRKV